MNGFASMDFNLRPRQAGKIKFYMNQSEIDCLRENYKDNELEFNKWLEEHVELYEVLPEEPTLIERLNEKHGPDKKEAPALNRADRRRLRHAKTRR